MKSFACGDVVPGCGAVLSGEDADEVVNAVEEHAREAHGFEELPTEVEERVRAEVG